MKNIFFALVIIVFIFIGYTSNRTDKKSITDDKTFVKTDDVKNVKETPLFELPDYTGRKVSSLDFKGKVMVINSWAVWCTFCKDELGDFAKLQEEFKDEIVVVAIDRAESISKAKGFTDSIDITNKMMFLLDASDSFYKSIGGFAMPETVFTDTSGKIISHKRGPMKLDEMRENILKIIGEKVNL